LATTLEALALAASVSALTSLAVSYLVSRHVARLHLRVIGLAGERVAARLAKRRLARRRKRYVVFEVSGGPVAAEALDAAIRAQMKKLLGVKGLSDAGYKLVYFDPRARRGVVRVYSDYKLHVIGVLGLVRRVGDRPVLVYPIATAGSLKKAGSRLRAP
jgi:ribonuclease P/MRP protein subunit POP5